MKLQIWKIDQNKEFTTDDAYPELELDMIPADPNFIDQKIVDHARELTRKHAPVIDCAGYRGIVLDQDSNEIAVVEKMY